MDVSVSEWLHFVLAALWSSLAAMMGVVVLDVSDGSAELLVHVTVQRIIPGDSTVRTYANAIIDRYVFCTRRELVLVVEGGVVG